ncbi:auxin-responsive protein SAUR76 [Apium graveolens]|uniref:auxin-responsive protein SAUR76 n=1 Tax=Apium graveolens TaxID=4045 RepID=UPI003D793957
MKKLNLMLRKCKTLSRQLGRSSSYSSLRSKSTRDALWGTDQYHSGGVANNGTEHRETIIVGSSRRRYAVKSEFLSHPLLSALIEKSKKQNSGCGNDIIAVKCEVVLFDHLLWMLENADPTNLTSDSLEELADLYVVS